MRLIESWPEQEPEWLRQPPAPTGENYYFVGTSESAREEAAAKDLAVADALKKAAAYTGVSITAKSDRSTATNYQASGTADPTISDMASVMQSARAWFSRFVPEQWYVEHFGVVEKKMLGERFIEGEDFYRASVLLSIPATEIENAVSEAKKRHARAFDELVPMDDLKAEEQDLLARVKKIKQHVDQMEANERLKQKISALERRIELGIRNDDELNDIKAELQDSEKSISFKVSGEGLFASALGEIDIRKQSMQAVDELLDLAVTDGFNCEVDVKKIKTEPSKKDESRVTVYLPFTISIRPEYKSEVIRRLSVFNNKGTGYKEPIGISGSMGINKAQLYIEDGQNPNLTQICLLEEVADKFEKGWIGLRLHGQSTGGLRGNFDFNDVDNKTIFSSGWIVVTQRPGSGWSEWKKGLWFTKDTMSYTAQLSVDDVSMSDLARVSSIEFKIKRTDKE